MLLSILRHGLLVVALGSYALADPVSPHETEAQYKAIALEKQGIYQTNILNKLLKSPTTKCNVDNIHIRRAWDDLTEVERLNYLNAVKCLTTKPARTPTYLASGVENWRDDFTYIHINQSNFVHQSGLFLPWHRQFLWSYEQALRNECGLTTAFPYWSWERHTKNQSANPIFKSGPTGMGGDGISVPHGKIVAPLIGIGPPAPPPAVRGAGKGGGCITDGAFSGNYTINLGPVSPQDPKINTPDNIFGYKANPRCIKRSFYQPISDSSLTYKTIATLWTQPTIHDFHPIVEVTPHVNAHMFVGGEENDLYTSPNDPIFFMVHSQVDRMWSVWQGQDYKTRTDALDGTLTFLNYPLSPNATLDTIMHEGIPAGGDIPIRYAMSTTDNDYCYMYA